MKMMVQNGEKNVKNKIKKFYYIVKNIRRCMKIANKNLKTRK